MRIKYLLFPLFFLVVFTANIADAQQSSNTGAIKAIDHIVAVVNGECITRQELNEVVKLSIMQLKRQGIQPPAKDVMESQVLEREIITRAQIQLAEEIGMTIGDIEVEKAIDRIANSNKMAREEFYSVLAKEGISFDKFREEIRKEMILVRLKDREVIKKIKVSEGEVVNFLYNQAHSSGNTDEYQLSHIMIRTQNQASPSQIESKRQRAEAALAKLKNGDDFAQVAAEFSDAADALDGGKLGWSPATQLPVKFSESLKLIAPGELTPIIQSPGGFHILKLHEKRGEERNKVVVIDQTHVRHILIKVSELTSENDARIRIIRLKERLDNGADFEELAKLHSEDTSAQAGGDLNWVSPGDTVAEFEQTMNGLQPGKISAPVQSTFGWHLIQVVERRTKDVSNERQRQEASNTLRTRKSDEAYQEWVQQLRDRAYVEYRSEEI